jgi:hypothetical protein
LIIGKVLLQERLLSSNGRSVVLAKGGVTTVQQILNRNACSAWRSTQWIQRWTQPVCRATSSSTEQQSLAATSGDWTCW